jgi:tetratricopeptide (TPR) repeat protein
MEICKNCSSEVNPTSVYCNNCGYKLKASLLNEHVSFEVDLGNGLKIPTNPLSFEYCLQIGANAYHKGEYYEAIEYLTHALTFNETPIKSLSNCYNEIGISYMKLRKDEIAVKYLRLSIAANPEYIIPRENLVSTLCALDDVNSAFEEFKRLALDFPDFNPRLWHSIGIACENSKRYPDAKKFYEKAIECGIENAEEDLLDVIRKMNATNI